MSVLPDFDKYSEILIHNSNSVVGAIDERIEWNKNCHSCNKFIKVILFDHHYNVEWSNVPEYSEEKRRFHLL
jgi:hypothetical protein